MFRKLRSKVQRLVQTLVWGMDIDPSARIEAGALIDRTWPRGIHIGPDCHICEEAVVLTHDRTRGLYLDTRIGARSYVGQRAIILPGLNVGEDSIVMPGALVTKDVPPRSVVTGNPAQIAPRDGTGLEEHEAVFRANPL